MHGTWTQKGNRFTVKYNKDDIVNLFKNTVCSLGYCTSDITITKAELSGNLNGNKISGKISFLATVHAKGHTYIAKATGNFSGSKTSNRQEAVNSIKSFMQEIIEQYLNQ